MEERDMIILFHQLDGVGPVTIRKLYYRYGSLCEAARATENELKEIGIHENVISQILNVANNGCVQLREIARENAENNIHIITIQDNEYPRLLQEIHDPPNILFVKGDVSLLNENLISVVGTREPTYYGKWAAHELGSFLAEQEVPVVSGLAKGIDRYVHEGVLSKKGKCIAVVATGLAHVYPKENKKLHDDIINTGGCIVSEYSLYTKAKPGQFPARNRIISGLSLGTIVVESKEKGGALITADQALEQNREVFALPGNINSPNSIGTNSLLKQGARLLMKWEDIFEEIPVLSTEKSFAIQDESIKQRNIHDISKEELKILSIIPYQEIHIDELMELYKEPDLYLLLIQLQLKKYIENLPGQYYVRLQ